MTLCSVQALGITPLLSAGSPRASSRPALRCTPFCHCSAVCSCVSYRTIAHEEWCAVLQSGTRIHLPPSPARVVAALPVLATDLDPVVAEPVGVVSSEGLLALACVALRFVLLDDGAGWLSSEVSPLWGFFFDFLVLVRRSARVSIRRSGTGVYCVPRSLPLEKRTPSPTMSASSNQNRRCGNHSCFQSTLPPSRRCVAIAPPPLQPPQNKQTNKQTTSC